MKVDISPKRITYYRLIITNELKDSPGQNVATSAFIIDFASEADIARYFDRVPRMKQYISRVHKITEVDGRTV